MKKAVLIAILVSAVIIAGAYYYFFILMGHEEGQTLPSKVKIAIKMPVTETKPAEQADKTVPKVGKVQENKKVEQAKQELKKEESKKVEAKKEEPKKIEPKKAEPQKAQTVKEEPKKETPEETKKDVKETVTPKPQRKVVGYRLEYSVKDDEEAAKIREMLISNGYHTAKKVALGKSYKVIVSPFTDKWEAEYVRDNIKKETKLSFSVKAVYK